jgi:hypothetical protein
VKKINYYNQNLNKCSIQPITDSTYDRVYLELFLKKILNASSLIILEARRPLTIIDVDILNYTKIKSQADISKISADLFDLFFLFKKKNVTYDFFNLCFNLWFNYEHVSYTFLIHEEDLETPLVFSSSNTFLSQQILLKNVSFFNLSKGIEEDVLWVRKSNDMEFINIMHSL